MARWNTHPKGKPAGLSPPDLQADEQPAAYLTRQYATRLECREIAGGVREF